MSRKYLRSDLSIQEAHFFTCGNLVIGDDNAITGLIKIVGKYSELYDLNRKQEIISYNPDEDRHFKYESRGYSIMGDVLKQKHSGRGLSRKYLKHLSRTWGLSPVIISFKCDCIISELITYIKNDPDLKEACEKYILTHGKYWQRLMPIQANFLSTRHTDQHKDYQVAGEIINKLSSLNL